MHTKQDRIRIVVAGIAIIGIIMLMGYLHPDECRGSEQPRYCVEN